MAEIAIGALAAAGKGLSTVASGLFGGGAAAGAAGGASGLLSSLGTAVKILGTLGAANAAARSSRDQAAAATLEAGQERVDNANRQLQISRELARVLGENDAAFAAAGIDLGGGVAQDARSAAQKRAAETLTIERSDSEFRRALLRLRANGLRRQASSQSAAGLFSAIDIGFGAAGAAARRGGVGATAGGNDPWAGLR